LKIVSTGNSMKMLLLLLSLVFAVVETSVSAAIPASLPIGKRFPGTEVRFTIGIGVMEEWTKYTYYPYTLRTATSKPRSRKRLPKMPKASGVSRGKIICSSSAVLTFIAGWIGITARLITGPAISVGFVGPTGTNAFKGTNSFKLVQNETGEWVVPDEVVPNLGSWYNYYTPLRVDGLEWITSGTGEDPNNLYSNGSSQNGLPLNCIIGKKGGIDYEGPNILLCGMRLREDTG
jgi:hypothetical protein